MTARSEPNVEVRVLGRDDAAVLGRVADGVFDDPPDPALVDEFLADPRHHLAVASSAGVVIGMASAVHYVHPDKPAELWVNEIGVAPDFRRQGVGRRLLEALFARGRASGCTEAWLGTERSNVAARGLYASAGGKEADMLYVAFALDRPTDEVPPGAATDPDPPSATEPSQPHEEPAMTDRTVRLHRVIRTDPAKVYRAFVEPEAMAKWLPPYGFTCTVQHLDARVGGTFRMSFRNFTSGNGHSFGGEYLELVPGELIRYTDEFDDPNLPGTIEVTVSLKPVLCGTELSVTQSGIPEAIPLEMCYLGWQESLTQLIALVEPEIPG